MNRPLYKLDRQLAALADHFTGNEVSFSITYLASITLYAWYAGRRAVLFMAVTASIVWLCVYLFSGQVYTHPMIPIWNSLVRLGFFLIITALLLHIRQLLARLQNQAEPTT